MSQSGNIPIIILKEGTGRNRGEEAQTNNIQAGKILSEVLRSSLGPRGMDKMLVSSLGDVKVTADGATILKEIDIQHPAAKMMVEAAKAQDIEVGDGTTTIVVLAGELLKRTEELLRDKIHATSIVAGYRKASEKAIEILKKISIPVKSTDKDAILKIAKTSLGSKVSATVRDIFAEIAFEAVTAVVEERDGKKIVDKDRIQLTKKAGGSLSDTRLIKGLVVDKEVMHPGMPKRVEKAKIALIQCALEIEKPEFSSEIRIKDPRNMQAFLDEETKMLKAMTDKIVSTGANVAICQRGVDDMAAHFLAKAGILTVRRAKFSDLERLEKSTGAKQANSIEDLKRSDLGYAELVEERKFGDDKLLFIEGCKDPHSVSIFIRGGLERVTEEAERAINDAISVVADVFKDGRAVAGGGAVEIELARQLREYANQVGGREQLCIKAFADSLEIIPKTLAENAGLDSLNTLVSLRAAHEKKNGRWMGVDLTTGESADMIKAGVLEPTVVKESAIESAFETATMIIRIDDVIAAKAGAPPMPPAGGMPPGGGMLPMGGGMPPMM